MESVRASWARDDYSKLQPDTPDVLYPCGFLAVFMNASCGARETKLQGTSSVGALSAWEGREVRVGRLSAMPVRNQKEEEDST
jgi:hypothetical protein